MNALPRITRNAASIVRFPLLFSRTNNKVSTARPTEIQDLHAGVCPFTPHIEIAEEYAKMQNGHFGKRAISNPVRSVNPERLAVRAF